MGRGDMTGFKVFYLGDTSTIAEADEFFQDHKIIKWDFGYDRNYIAVEYSDYNRSIDVNEIKSDEEKFETVQRKVNTKETKIKLNKKITELEGKLANLSAMLGEGAPPRPQVPPKICGFCNATLPAKKEDQVIHLNGECING